jgi:hypothetical protein
MMQILVNEELKNLGLHKMNVSLRDAEIMEQHSRKLLEVFKSVLKNHRPNYIIAAYLTFQISLKK